MLDVFFPFRSSSDEGAELFCSSVGKSSNEASGAGPNLNCLDGYEPRDRFEVDEPGVTISERDIANVRQLHASTEHK